MVGCPIFWQLPVSMLFEVNGPDSSWQFVRTCPATTLPFKSYLNDGLSITQARRKLSGCVLQQSVDPLIVKVSHPRSIDGWALKIDGMRCMSSPACQAM